jgi:hypothetical protein
LELLKCVNEFTDSLKKKTSLMVSGFGIIFSVPVSVEMPHVSLVTGF